jgi:hypothetical protein
VINLKPLRNHRNQAAHQQPLAQKSKTIPLLLKMMLIPVKMTLPPPHLTRKKKKKLQSAGRVWWHLIRMPTTKISHLIRPINRPMLISP